jgi:hypothetical protein
VTAVVVSLVLVFQAGLIHPYTAHLAERAYTTLSANAVGVFAGVEPNELNRLSAELAERERELARREAALQSDSFTGRDFPTTTSQNLHTYILSLILFVLTVLIVMNYVLDWRRYRRSLS